MEGMGVVDSMVQFQGSSVLSKELLNNPTMIIFQAMTASGQLQGASELLDENFANCSEFLHTHQQPIPYEDFSFLDPASATLDKEASNRKIAEQEAPLLEGETQLSFLNTLLHNHYKNISASELVEVPPFAASKNKFIFFDKSGENERTFLSPYTVCGNFTSIAEEPDEIDSCIKGCYCQTNYPLFKTQGENNIDPMAGKPSIYRKMIPSSAFAVLESLRCSRASSLSICKMDDELHRTTYGAFEFDCPSSGSCGESSHRGVTEFSESLHEDTWELEALMSSDEDEMSTGHSPSDPSWNNMLKNINGSSSNTGKRKACDNEWNKEVDCDSSCQEVESVYRDQCFDLSVMNDGTYQNNLSRTIEPVMGLTELDSLSGLHQCTPLQKSSNAKMCQALTSLSRQSASRKRPRKDKIRKTVKLLRSVVPRGDSMSTADFLGEAIQYVRKLQLKVSKLEQSKELGFDDGIVGAESSLHIAKRNWITSC